MFKGALHPYQEPAVDLVVDQKTVLVSYDMGLGKTVIAIAAAEKTAGTTLVVCTASLKGQWQSAIHQFTDSTALIIDGSPAKRAELYQDYHRFDYVIINYDLVWRDIKILKDMSFRTIILDEATAIKNPRSKRTKAVRKLKAESKVALTGTPIENGKLDEMYQIMRYINPNILGDFRLFDETFVRRDHWGSVQSYRNMGLFHKTMAPWSIRKAQTDSDVASFLPELMVVPPLTVTLDNKAKKLYRHIVAEILATMSQLTGTSSFSLESLYGMGSSSRDLNDPVKGAIMSQMLCLKMLCVNPDLIRASANKFSDIHIIGGSKYARELVDDGLLNGITAQPKLDAVGQRVNDVLDADPRNKVIIFSRFVDNLYALSSLVGDDRSCIYSGKLSSSEKDSAKVLFNTDPECRVFISSDAGGYGVDLPAANMLINFDAAATPGAKKQRDNRHNRVSSLWKTIITQDAYVLGSIEEWEHAKLTLKQTVSDAAVDGKLTADGAINMSMSSLSKFLRESTI